MKKLLSLISCILFLSVSALYGQDIYRVVNCKSHISIREYKSTKAPVLATVKLNEEVNARTGNTLFCYAKNSWNRAQFALQITPKKQLEARFTQVVRKQEQVLTSKQLDIKPGVFYTVRIAATDGGMMKIFLDGELVAMREKDSWSFNRLSTPKIPSGYPLLVLGGNLAAMKTEYRTLNGVIDDVKIWNTFKEADAAASVEAGSSLLVVEGKKSVTGKFLVLDRPTRFLGGFERPEQKFFDAAAALTPVGWYQKRSHRPGHLPHPCRNESRYRKESYMVRRRGGIFFSSGPDQRRVFSVCRQRFRMDDCSCCQFS